MFATTTPAGTTLEAPALQIVNTTEQDWDAIIALFEQVLDLQGKSGYKVWASIDQRALHAEIAQGLHYKLVAGEAMLGIFSVGYSDPHIWGDRDQHDAVYLHRVVINPAYKGQKQFLNVVAWAEQQARQMQRPFVRFDTWADNPRIIAYYQSLGFEWLGNYTTSDSPELPVQNRNLHVALLERRIA